jgi:hypothetical protein
MRIFVVTFALFFLSIWPVAAQDFVDPSVNVGQIPPSGTDRGGRLEGTQSGGGASEQVINPYDPKYRPLERYKLNRRAAAKLSVDILEPVLSPALYHVSFIRPADLKQNEIAVRIAKKERVTGCTDLALPAPVVEMIPPFMRITVPPVDLKLQTDVKRPHYACPKASKMAYTDLRFNLKKLAGQGIQYFYFKNEYGQDRYDLLIDERTVGLEPVTQNAFKAYQHAGRKNPLMHYILPQNTIMIDAPKLVDKPPYGGVKQDRIFVLRQYAQTRGFTPLQDILPEFSQPARPPYFVVDTQGIFYDRLNAREYSVIGYIKEPETWHGGDGPYERVKKLDVMAKRPGLYD